MHQSGGDGAEAQARRILFGLGFDELMQVKRLHEVTDGKHTFRRRTLNRLNSCWGIVLYINFILIVVLNSSILTKERNRLPRAPT